MPTSAITPHILEQLLKPSAYPVHTHRVDLIQTHVSWLFLTDSHVFKLKKPVNFGFLDFSTVALRHLFCQEELRLNRRLCPDMYEQVIELRTTATGVSFAGEGAVIDYAVMMKRLPAGRMLDRLVDNGSVSVDEIQNIARVISHFHSNAPSSPHISDFGSLEQISFNWQENFEQTRQFHDSTLPSAVSRNIRLFVETFINTHRQLFEERISDGHIRDCDGDIHLANICIDQDRVYIFDCIEFNERFRCSDTAADISFLLMDLDFHHRPDLADAALSTYIEASGDLDCQQLITFYKVYRAFVRGKVTSLQLLDVGITPDKRAVARQNASRYFRLAQGYCIRDSIPATLFITCGTMGSGKSTLAAQLAFELGIPLFSSDTERKRLAGLELTSPVAVPFGEGLYNEVNRQQTYVQLAKLADTALASGHSVIIDAGFGSTARRSECATLAAVHRVQFVILYVQCDPDEQQRRLKKRVSRGDSDSDGRVELLAQQTVAFEPPSDSEGITIIVSTNVADSHQPLDTIYERLTRV